MPTNVKVNLSHLPKLEDELISYPWDIMLEQGFHWMDRYGQAYWIPDMETRYLENALRFAVTACYSLSGAWWRFAMRLNGDMATDMAEREAERFGDCDVPLVKGLANELARRQGDQPPHDEWELVDSDLHTYLQDLGYGHMAVLDAIYEKGMYSTPIPGVYKLGEPFKHDD